VFTYLKAAHRRYGMSYPGKQQLHIVVNLGLSAYRGARVAVAGTKKIL
jgi:hypothetical protein